MEFYTPLSTPDGYKKRLPRCPQGKCVGYMMMPSPKGSARFAQFSRESRAARPHQRQGSALHPALDTRHTVPWIQRALKAVIGRAEVQLKLASGGRGHDRAARLRFLGARLSDHRPLRGFRRAACSANIRYRGAAYYACGAGMVAEGFRSNREGSSRGGAGIGWCLVRCQAASRVGRSTAAVATVAFPATDQAAEFPACVLAH